MSIQNWQLLSSVQDDKMLSVTNITRTSNTIEPLSVLSIISGAGDIDTIVPPIDGYHELSLMFTEDFIFLVVGGNIILTDDVTVTAPINKIVKVVYNPVTKKYYVLGSLIQ